MCVCVAKSLLKQATGKEKRYSSFPLTSPPPPPRLLPHPPLLVFSPRAQEYRLGPWDKERVREKEGGDADS